ncbi:Beta-lactamase [Carpediemonas membranifera]|uniref:Beta-lactamase n=1 Tax=Carpediemonas membranifera TaxID=201153 RepID=A0A8J6AV11_9EUKA|nr:Beta-lactamase [Carpediemonas membranifera]|eukprot:KAG9394888.1 Beta-lactamase [Carpediemonas membranifera]
MAERRGIAERVRFRDIIYELQTTQGYECLQACLVCPDGEVFSFASGYARTTVKEKKKNSPRTFPITIDTTFRLGTSSSLFVTAAIMRLITKNQLSLHSTVDRWFPNLPRDITIESLLTHQSGLTDVLTHPLVTLLSEMAPSHKWNARHVVKRLLSKKQRFPAFAGVAYSATNFLLLALIVEAISGKTYREYLVSERIINPKFVSFLDNGAEVDPRLIGGIDETAVTGPTRVKPRFSQRDSLAWATGAGVASATTMALWVREMATTDRFFDRHLFYEMEQIPDAPRIGPAGNGLGTFATGLSAGRMCGKPVYGHCGQTRGYESLAVYCPEEGYSIALNANSSRELCSLRPIAQAIVSEMIPMHRRPF